MTSFHCHDFDWNELAAACEGQLATPVENVDTSNLCTLAQDNWDVFHAKNNGKVYKPRNYLYKEFPELLKDNLTLLEIGCGYGSAIFPLLAQSPSMFAHVCDFSQHAITILQENSEYDGKRCHAFVCDVVSQEIDVPDASIDIVLMIFVLSAIPPHEFDNVMAKIYKALKPGGIVCFRDYGLYDLAMLRSSKRIESTSHGFNSLYYRSDGTLAYFFSKGELERIFTANNRFQVVENEYNTVRLRNRKTQTNMDRVWVHGKFQKI
ncbi:methyltransferase domain-containing protein [Thraustotheca clavata]|uniref:tRNA N(3)-methylcytidine methyltransferase n=1 Tax=Thraustotheca clavata TaxID=74557 RepID=A0A1V9Y4H0_9STRA|nr:methyltransferase domain-containing protein [Thraustotheca clavata]